MRASPVTIIIIYSLQCTLLLRKRATGCPRVPRTIRAAVAATPVAPAPLYMFIVVIFPVHVYCSNIPCACLL